MYTNSYFFFFTPRFRPVRPVPSKEAIFNVRQKEKKE
jgi:hypothetical protein